MITDAAETAARKRTRQIGISPPTTQAFSAARHDNLISKAALPFPIFLLVAYRLGGGQSDDT